VKQATTTRSARPRLARGVGLVSVVLSALSTSFISETQLEYLSVDHQASVTDGDFTQQRLTQGL